MDYEDSSTESDISLSSSIPDLESSDDDSRTAAEDWLELQTYRLENRRDADRIRNRARNADPFQRATLGFTNPDRYLTFDGHPHIGNIVTELRAWDFIPDETEPSTPLYNQAVPRILHHRRFSPPSQLRRSYTTGSFSLDRIVQSLAEQGLLRFAPTPILDARHRRDFYSWRNQITSVALRNGWTQARFIQEINYCLSYNTYVHFNARSVNFSLRGRPVAVLFRELEELFPVAEFDEPQWQAFDAHVLQVLESLTPPEQARTIIRLQASGIVDDHSPLPRTPQDATEGSPVSHGLRRHCPTPAPRTVPRQIPRPSRPTQEHFVLSQKFGAHISLPPVFSPPPPPPSAPTLQHTTSNASTATEITNPCREFPAFSRQFIVVLLLLWTTNLANLDRIDFTK